MNRVEILREYIDDVLLNQEDDFLRRSGYLHLYGVAQAAALIAMKRGEDIELSIMAAMLHDIYTYKTGDTEEHAKKGSILAREILEELKIANDEEIDLICEAIYNHSKKRKEHSSFTEVLIDADVMQHCLYNPSNEIYPKKVERFEKLKIEFGLINKTS